MSCPTGGAIIQASSLRRVRAGTTWAFADLGKPRLRRLEVGLARHGFERDRRRMVDSLNSTAVVVLSKRQDGSVLRGRRLPFAEALYAAGTPPMWGLAKRPEPHERVSRVRIDDLLTVERDDRGWTVSDAAGVLGRTRWRPADDGKIDARTGVVLRYPKLGTLVVSQVLQRDGRVVDFGGVVTPSAAAGER